MDSDINYIIREARKGDKNYQELLLKKLHPLIYKNIYEYYRYGEEGIEDLVQEGYIVILKSLIDYEENREAHFLSYVKSNIYYFYKNHFRNTKKSRENISLNQKFGTLDGTELENVLASIETTEDKIIDDIEKMDLVNNISKLSKKEQDVLNLYYFDELTMKEISSRLNIAYRTAIGRKYNAIQNLKRLMTGGEYNG